jgi:hypothetical protein
MRPAGCWRGDAAVRQAHGLKLLVAGSDARPNCRGLYPKRSGPCISARTSLYAPERSGYKPLH